MQVLKSQSRYYPSVWHTSFSAALRRRSWTRWTQHHHLAVCWPGQNWGQLHTPEKHTHTQSPTSSPNLFNHMQVSSFLPDGALFGGTHRTRVRLANQKQVVGSGPRRGFESAYARGKLGFLFAQADYECTQLGWVWLNENLFNSAARNPGLQVKTMFWFTFRGNLMNAALFSPCSQISISSGEAQSCQKSPEWWVSSDVNE